jgi:two-component sensor histidine kinase
LRSIAEAVITPLVGAESFANRVQVNGPDVGLNSGQVQNFALAFHELATNSLKHGALSGQQGAVRITWTVQTTPVGPTLGLRWEEVGGPAVCPPTQKGFGRLMIETLVPRALGGKGVLQFDEKGVVWALTVPVQAPGAEY